MGLPQDYTRVPHLRGSVHSTDSFIIWNSFSFCYNNFIDFFVDLGFSGAQSKKKKLEK